jgi:undecaprenyl-diphosphatase
MNFLQAIIMGIVEGITEFLPISSTAHLILTSRLLGLDQTEFLKSFEIIIQLGAILAVVFLYWKAFLNAEVIKRLLVAFFPTAILGFIFYGVVKQFLMSSETLLLWSLLLGGIVLILFEWWHKEGDDSIREIANIPYRKCFFIGIFQSVAMIPGVSRSAATILGGLFMGLGRKTIVEFSFLLAVPTMMGASGLDLAKSAGQFSSSQFNVLAVGFVTSFVMAILGIKFLLAYVQRRTFVAFGVYRIIIAFLFFALK